MVSFEVEINLEDRKCEEVDKCFLQFTGIHCCSSLCRKMSFLSNGISYHYSRL